MPIDAEPRPRILLTRCWPAEVVSRLRGRYEVVVDEQDRPLDEAALTASMRTCDAICPTVTDRIGASILDAPGARVRILANYGAGFEHIDLVAASRAGIVVSNTPDVLTDATAELALTLMLMASRRASEGERELRSGQWTGWRPTHLVGLDLRGKVLGLVGFGRIAQRTARLAQAALGMHILYHSRRRAEPPAELAGATFVEDLDALLAQADVISLHCPGGAETHHLIDAARLGRVKPTAILINTARGTVVDERALAAALRDGRLAAAGLDVYEREPRVWEGLLPLANAVLLPHLGSATADTRIAMGMRAADNLDAFFDGRTPPDLVA